MIIILLVNWNFLTYSPHCKVLPSVLNITVDYVVLVELRGYMFYYCVIIFRQLEYVRVQLQLQLHFCMVRLQSWSSVFMIYMSLSNVKTTGFHDIHVTFKC